MIKGLNLCKMLGYNLFKLQLYYLSIQLEGMGSLRVDNGLPVPIPHYTLPQTQQVSQTHANH